MKKKSTRILAIVLTGVLLVSLAVPAALAARAEGRTSGTDQAQTTQSGNGRQRGKCEHRTNENAGCAESGDCGCHAKPEEPAEPENAIGKDAAKEAALVDAGLTAEQVGKMRARLSDKDGTLVYKVSFKYDGQKYSYKIDPVSGEILDKTVGEAAEHSWHGHGHTGSMGSPEKGEDDSI
ncbi:MAG: PepSY domain-containing protein [Clostridia bacterium]|nr:PepSY domain-containing protein [Clostridia bacterium]